MLGLNCSQSGFTEVTDAFIASLPTVPRDGTLLKEHDDPAVYVMYGGMKSHIQSPDILLDCGYMWENVGVVPNGALGPLATTFPLGYPSCAPEAPPPDLPGDNFDDSTEIPTLPHLWSSSTEGYTTEPGEPVNPNSCLGAGSAIGRTAWYRFTAPEHGDVFADALGSDFDTVLSAYSGSSLQNLVLRACNDDSSGLQSRISFPVVAGGTYYLQLGGYNSSFGSSALNISLSTPPPPAKPVSFAMGVDSDGNGTNDCGTGVPSAIGNGAPDAVPVEITNSTCNAPLGSNLRASVYLMDNAGVAYAGAQSHLYFNGIGAKGRGSFLWACHTFDATYGGAGVESAASAIGIGAPCNVPQANLGVMNRFTFTCAASGTLQLAHGVGETALTDNSLVEHRDVGSDVLAINCEAPPTPTRTATALTPTSTFTPRSPTPTFTPDSVTVTRTPTHVSVPPTATRTATQPHVATPTATVGVLPRVELNVSAASVSPGALTVAVLQAIAESPGVGAYTIDLVYDPSVVRAVGCDVPAFGVCSTGFGPDQVRITSVSANGVVGSVTLGEVVFEAAGEPGDCSDLWIEVALLAEPGGQSLPFSASAGRICVEDTGAIGDTDCDRSITSLDALYIVQYAAGIVNSLVCQDGADANRDGRVDALDAMLILQYVAGVLSRLS